MSTLTTMTMSRQAWRHKTECLHETNQLIAWTCQISEAKSLVVLFMSYLKGRGQLKVYPLFLVFYVTNP